jgi:hypothetical protein
MKDKVASLYFFGTPSSGSQMATIGRTFLPNAQLKDISPSTGDDFLRELHEMWLAAGDGRAVASYCACGQAGDARDVALASGGA